MCKVGGPRCDSRVRERYVAAERAYRAALVLAEPSDEGDGQPRFELEEAAEDARRELDAAYGEMCSTQKGEDEVRQMVLEGRLLSGTLAQHLETGQHFRRRGRIVRAVRAVPEGLPLDGVLGRTGDPRVDASVDRAARMVAANWSDYTDPIPAKLHRSTALVARADESAEQRWKTQIQQQFTAVRSEEARLADAERDVSFAAQRLASSPGDTFAQSHLAQAQESLGWAKGRLRHAEMALVIYADQLHQVQRRQAAQDGANPNTPPEALGRLAADAPVTRIGRGPGPNTPPEVLRRLADKN